MRQVGHLEANVALRLEPTGTTGCRLMPTRLHGLARWAGMAACLGACQQEPAVHLATPVAALVAGPLPEGPQEAAVVFVSPGAKSAGPHGSGGKSAERAVDPGRPELGRTDPPRTDAPKADPGKGKAAELAAAERELARIQADTAPIADAEAKLRQAQTDLAAAGGPTVLALQTAEKRLQELIMIMGIETEQVRQNKCCSVCGLSKTEIESKGEPFEKHLTNVKGTVAECKAGKLEAVQRKYEGPIAAAKGRVAELKAKSGPESAAAQAKVDAAKAGVDQAKAEHAKKVQAAQEKVDAARRGH